MRKFWILLTALLCLLAGCAEEPADPTLPPPETNPYSAADFTYEGERLTCLTGEAVAGIDVSTFQGDIDWDAVAADGIEFAMVRVGYRGIGDGLIDEDVKARANIEGALAAGLDVGVYFFSQAITPQEAAREAAFVISYIEPYDITMPVVFDWEHVDNPKARTSGIYDRELLTECALTFAQMVETAGYEPMIYFNSYQSRELLDLQRLKDYRFWLALYDSPMNFPWQIDMWQYSDHGTVAGIRGNVDLNLYFPG